MFSFAKSPAPAVAGASRDELAGVESKLAEAGAKRVDAESRVAQLEGELASLKPLEQMVDQIPINVMMCDPKTLEINYINQTSVKTLKGLEHLLPVKADRLMGQCIDIFHKNPEHRRHILGNPETLPYNAPIQLGDEWLDLQVNAITDAQGVNGGVKRDHLGGVNGDHLAAVGLSPWSMGGPRARRGVPSTG